MTGKRVGNRLRFDPPPTPVPAAAGWVLRRAFAVAGDAAHPDDPALAADWAARLGLAERIAGRHGERALRRELGDTAAGGLVAASRRAAVRNLLLRELAALATRVAAERGIQVLLLKGMALLDESADLDGCRSLADVDILVETAAAAELSLALERAGWDVSPIHESAHHLPALQHPRLGSLEIHLHLPGVRVGGGGWAGAAEILASGLHHPAAELAPARVPARPLLAAHAIAHALEQNAYSPDAYPQLRLIADLQDLTASGGGTTDLVAAAAAYLADSVSRRELDALDELFGSLVRGALPTGGTDAARLLDHVFAAHLSPGYRRALKASALGAAVRRRDWFKIRRRLTLAAARDRRRMLLPTLTGVFRVGWSWLLQRFRRRGPADIP